MRAWRALRRWLGREPARVRLAQAAIIIVAVIGFGWMLGGSWR